MCLELKGQVFELPEILAEIGLAGHHLAHQWQGNWKVKTWLQFLEDLLILCKALQIYCTVGESIAKEVTINNYKLAAMFYRVKLCIMADVYTLH